MQGTGARPPLLHLPVLLLLRLGPPRCALAAARGVAPGGEQQAEELAVEAAAGQEGVRGGPQVDSAPDL